MAVTSSITGVMPPAREWDAGAGCTPTVPSSTTAALRILPISLSGTARGCGDDLPHRRCTFLDLRRSCALVRLISLQPYDAALTLEIRAEATAGKEFDQTIQTRPVT